jgi:hypothetical protein
LKAKGVPNEFWGEAVNTAVHLLNCAPTKSVRDATPHEAWHGAKPAVGHFRTFGCIAHVKITKPGLKKLDDRSLRTVFIGYEHGTSKAWRVYDPVGKRVHITRDTVFDELASWSWETPEQEPGSFIIDYAAPIGVTPAPASHREKDVDTTPSASSPAPAPTPLSSTVTPAQEAFRGRGWRPVMYPHQTEPRRTLNWREKKRHAGTARWTTSSASLTLSLLRSCTSPQVTNQAPSRRQSHTRHGVRR